jgi:hypothetical protein
MWRFTIHKLARKLHAAAVVKRAWGIAQRWSVQYQIGGLISSTLTAFDPLLHLQGSC